MDIRQFDYDMLFEVCEFPSLVQIYVDDTHLFRF